MNPPQSKQRPLPPVAPGEGATLDQWLSWLESIHPTEIDLGLDRVLVVLRRLFRKNPTARVITVAGTNGKGSTVATLEALLLAAGRRTGAYTSPHLQKYNERIRIDGVDVDDATLISAFEKVEAARGSVTLTYFEFGTLAAFVALDEFGVQDWILEVGLGGRLDAVNVIDADLAIITSIDIDHVAFLGDNREVIGFEKAGILRPGIPAVVADEDPPRSVLQQAAAQKVALVRAGHEYTIQEVVTGPGESAVTLHVQDDSYRLPSGPLPVQSVAAAVMALRSLEPEMDQAAIEAALVRVKAPGRFERLGHKPDLYVDVGHNPHAAKWLSARLQALKTKGQKVHAVYAALEDKDVEGVAHAMAPAVDYWFLAGLDVHRGLGSETLRARLESAPLLHTSTHDTVVDAIAAAKAGAETQDIIIVFGSFFAVAGARRLLL
ncbi:MAG: bifunctional tetrahydrofolate synthase/dihydrofolate synthase [Marinobacter sp.]|uniref:bifunctional tetrahydrofolate synthase/dihydrofolate synthase n=1 Tax=Marinobacter sp. TaxID=50741 RepID=UPI001B7931C7|nr:bifunctional tetrahydrofolate synthase/dihydrofolate synthase [Marinobacter sp.]MBQ0747737.1 bifunctional tetrahydrofolate synthase/dihydrofolate synthase [Marinobacter sp.]MBQ0814991.1 bifunctional tetrahydrofolate synthase/dihydrofolate synthase [Marinobacter sp.]